MTVSNVLNYYLGNGVIASRPSGSDFGPADMGWYYATDTAQLSFWNGSAWVLAPGGGGGSAAKSASFTTVAGIAHYDVDTSGGAVTVTMNATPSANDVVEIWDATGNCGTNAISFAGNGHNIAGVSTISNFIAVNYGHARLRFNGTQWLIQ
jgi:hypothetical protein